MSNKIFYQWPIMLAISIAIALPCSVLIAKVEPAVPQEVPQSRRGGMHLDLLLDLELSDQQLLDIISIRRQAHSRSRQQVEQLRQAQTSLEELLAGTASAEEVRAQFDHVQQMRQTLAVEQFENLIAIREVLNPEQRRRLSERLRQQRAIRRREAMSS